MTEDNPVIQAMRTRRSVRHYRPGEVARETLEAIVDCGRLAPTSNNRQMWEFVVVTERETLVAIARLATFGRFVADAAAGIAVVGDPANRSVYLDGAAATENMLLAIHALGLASCWVQTFEKDYTAPLQQLLGVPEGLVLVSLVPVAWPRGETPRPKKRPLAEVLHWERF
jgi:nitroreductase